MKSTDISRPLTAHALNENMFKQFKVKIDFNKYTREQLEDYRNLLRTKVSQLESGSNFNDLLTNETYQRDKYMLGVLNTRIKEMLGESIVLAEKAVSKAQQKFMGMVHATQKGEKAPSKEVAKAAKGMSKKAAKDYASTKHKGLPAHVADESVEEGKSDEIADKLAAKRAERDDPFSPNYREKKEVKKAASTSRKVSGTRYGGSKQKDDEVDESAKPDFLDMDKDGNRKETMKKAVKDKKTMTKKVKEAAKPDFLDMDKDGDKKEPMKKAVKDKKKGAVKESKSELMHRAYQKFISEGIANYIAEDEEGKAKSITAAADMVNDFTSWMQRVGNYQTKSMIELADNIRANFGMQEAETFKQSVGAALEEALNALTSAREQINNAVAVLAGEAPAQEPMGMEPGGEAPGEFEMPQAGADEMNAGGDEFAAADAAAGGPETTGRVRRESIERGNRLMRILGS